MVVVRLVYPCVVLVLAILLHELPPLVELSHRTIVPEWPLNVRFPLLFPGHTDVLPLKLPPAIAATVIVAADELEDEQGPL